MEDLVAPTAGEVLDSPDAGRAAVRGSVIRSGGYVAGLGLAVIAAPLLIRHLGVTRFGQYTAVISLVTIVAGLTEGGINSIALRELAAREGADREQMMRDLIGIRIALSFAGAAIAIGFALVSGYSQLLVAGTAVAVSGLMLQVFQTLLGATLQTTMRFGWITTLDLVRQGVTVAVIVALALGGAGLFPFFLAPVAGGLATLSVTLRLVRGLVPLRPTWHASRWWPLLRATLPFAAAIAISVVYFRLGVVIMSVTASKAQTGYYSAAFRVVEVLIGVPPLIASAAFPIISRAFSIGDLVRVRYAAGRLIETTIALGVFLSLGLALGAKPVIDLIGGPAFAPSAVVLRIQGVGLIATCGAVSSGIVLLALHRTKAILLASALALVTSVVMCLVLIPMLAARGAALGVVAAEFVLAATEMTALLRVLPELRPSLLGRPLAIVACGGAAALVALIPGVPPVGDVVLGSVVYVGLLTLTGRLPDELRQLVSRRP
jgi:O-antigen/teichoic acid export membrane protein